MKRVSQQRSNKIVDLCVCVYRLVFLQRHKTDFDEGDNNEHGERRPRFVRVAVRENKK